MPQSWPSQWIILFIVFIFSFILVLILSFFLYSLKIQNSTEKVYSSNYLNWSW